MRDYTPQPIDAGVVLRSPVHFIAFGFGSGLSPKAPGTVGTLLALPFWWAMQGLPWSWYLAACGALFGFGCWVCGTSSRRLGMHDHGGIVFDEIVGMLVALLPLLSAGIATEAASVWWWLASFLLFRAFDIFKPWPIAWVDARVQGGFGIMVDDLLAGLMAAAVLWAILPGVEHGL